MYEDVRMISAEAPVLFAKACEMFILEMSLRGKIEIEREKERKRHNQSKMMNFIYVVYNFIHSIIAHMFDIYVFIFSMN